MYMASVVKHQKKRSYFTMLVMLLFAIGMMQLFSFVFELRDGTLIENIWPSMDQIEIVDNNSDKNERTSDNNTIIITGEQKSNAKIKDRNVYYKSDNVDNWDILTPFGKEYCVNNNKNKYKYKYLNVAGMRASGTNGLFVLLFHNCYGKEELLRAYPIIRENWINNRSNPLDLSQIGYNNLDKNSSIKQRIEDKFHTHGRLKVEYLSELNDINGVSPVTLEMLEKWLFGSQLQFNNNNDNNIFITKHYDRETLIELESKCRSNVNINADNSDCGSFMAVHWDTPIGKHSMNPSLRDLYYIRNNWDENRLTWFFNGLTVKTIKDPLTWIKSLCRHSYGIHFNHYFTHYDNFEKGYIHKLKPGEDKCPFNLSKIMNHPKIFETNQEKKEAYSKNIKSSNSFNIFTMNETEYQSSITVGSMYWNNIAQYWNDFHNSWLKIKNNKTVTFARPDIYGLRHGIENYEKYINITNSNKHNYNYNYSYNDNITKWQHHFVNDKDLLDFDQILQQDESLINILNKYRLSKRSLFYEVEAPMMRRRKMRRTRKRRRRLHEEENGQFFVLSPKDVETMLSIGHVMEQRANVPSLTIRMEDALFEVRKVVDFVCDCVGGIKRKNLFVSRQPAKTTGSGRTRKQLQDLYSNIDYRFELFSQQDIQFLRQQLDTDLLNWFGYQF